jgi:hypothetical protein
MLQVATTTTCCKSLKEILNTEMILSLQQRTNYINNYFINKNEKDVCTVCVPVFVHTCTHPVQKQNKPNKMKYVCFSSTAVHSVCNEFETLCWGHPEIIQLILAVGIGPCGTDGVGAQQMLFFSLLYRYQFCFRSYSFCFFLF